MTKVISVTGLGAVAYLFVSFTPAPTPDPVLGSINPTELTLTVSDLIDPETSEAH